MRHGSLFSGIGGFDLAASWMGWENVFQVEWDGWCQKVLAKNFPDTLRFWDIVEFNKMLQNGEIITDTKGMRDKRESRAMAEKEIKTGEQNDGAEFNSIGQNELSAIGRIDILTGGFPCQPFSHAGKRKGTDDSRYLWPEMLTTIRILKPSFVVGENVAGLVSMENGKTLDRILSDLENEGYTTEQVIIPACAVGAWHRRDRIWIIAYKSIQGLQGSRQKSRESKIQQENRIKQLCGNVPDSKEQRIQGVGRLWKQGTKEDAGQRLFMYSSDRNRTNSDWWQSESQLGGMVNGVPSELDGYWNREPKGVPRVAKGVKDRVNRLKGLGNAIVPQVALELFKAIDKSVYEGVWNL